MCKLYAFSYTILCLKLNPQWKVFSQLTTVGPWGGIVSKYVFPFLTAKHKLDVF